MPPDSASFAAAFPNACPEDAASPSHPGATVSYETVEATLTSMHQTTSSSVESPKGTRGVRLSEEETPVLPHSPEAVHHGIPPKLSSQSWTQSAPRKPAECPQWEGDPDVDASQSTPGAHHFPVPPQDPQPVHQSYSSVLLPLSATVADPGELSSSASSVVHPASACASERCNDHTAPTLQFRQSSHVPNASHYHHYGQTFNTTNTNYGPVCNANNIETANFQMNDGLLLWNDLPRQRDMSGQRNEYMEGSREADLQKIMQWTDHAPPGVSVLWIQGPAGIGKSTLARHLTHLLRAGNRLAASVFLSAVPSDTRGPESVVKIMARELGTLHPATIPVILSAISACHSAPLQTRIEKCLWEPVHSLQLPRPIVFILDAIDEWEHYDLLLKELHSADIPSAVRFLLLGRLDPRTRGFHEPWIHSHRLEIVPAATMERYFKQELSSIRWDRGWELKHNHIAKLAELADGLFVWATAVCSLLKKRHSRSTPRETLEAIIYTRRGLGAEGGLARLYHQAIVWLFPDQDDQNILRQYLGATLVLQEPLSADDFSFLTKLPIHVVESIKSDLVALQIQYPLDNPHKIYPAGTLFHLSFLQYLECSSTPPIIAFYISAFESHSQLAESCLSVLRDLHQTARRPSPSDLSARQTYVVKYMPTHVHQGSPSVKPDSDTDWRRTSHFSILQDIAIPSLVHWARLLVALVRPISSMESADRRRESAVHDPNESSTAVHGGFDGFLMEETENPCRSRGKLMVDVAARLREGGAATLPILISCLEVAVRLEHSNLESWGGLGLAYYWLAASTRSRNAWDQTVSAYRNALEAGGASGDTDKGELFYSLGTVLHDRYKYFGNHRDLSEAIALHRGALALRPPGHSGRSSSLNNLANALLGTGSVDDLQESICLHREALELRPPGHPDRALSLNNLATSLSETGTASDLQESVSLHRKVLELRPPGHPNRSESLCNLAYSLSKTGSIADVEESIPLYHAALELRPPGHPDRAWPLDRLALSLSKTRGIKD